MRSFFFCKHIGIADLCAKAVRKARRVLEELSRGDEISGIPGNLDAP